MAISRAQLLKELLPGLNALLVLSTASTKTNMQTSMRLKTQSVVLRKKSNCLVLVQHP